MVILKEMKGVMMRGFPQIIFSIVLSLATSPAFSQDAAPHRQFVISVSDSWNGSHATIYRFEQSAGKWKRVGRGMPAVVGEKGLGWDPAVPDRDPAQPVKKEGDHRAPAGIFPLSGALGFSPLPPVGVTLPYRTIREGTHCVDDVDSPYYNRIVSEQELSHPASELWHSSELMWQIPDLYKLLLLVDYNVREPKPGNGSCIFMHVWRGEGRPTTGCTALAEENLTEVMKWLKPDLDPVLVQLPLEVYHQVWQEWGLPAPELLKEEGGPKNNPLVEIRSVAPEVVVEMRYSRPDNFTGKTIYDCGRCFLRAGTAAKVARAARELGKKGLSLKMWDCYRPLSAQRFLWSLVPDPRFVADPRKGSRHNRGTAVDVTLVDATGHELEMPTRYDDFSHRAAHSETNLPAKVVANRRLLAAAMQEAGFRRLESEWWHYDDPDGEGEILDVPFTELCR